MTNTFQGNLNGHGLRIAIVVSRFNEFVTKALLEGALNELYRLGVESKDCDVAWVPGAFEIPFTCQEMARRDYDAVIALGCVIRGETSHYDHICQELARGIAAVSLQSGVPIIFGVLTTENTVQAIERAGGKHGNRGSQAAQAAVETARLVQQIGKSTFTEDWDRFRAKMEIPT